MRYLRGMRGACGGVYIQRACGVCGAYIQRACGVCGAYIQRACGVCGVYIQRACRVYMPSCSTWNIVYFGACGVCGVCGARL